MLCFAPVNKIQNFREKEFKSNLVVTLVLISVQILFLPFFMPAWNFWLEDLCFYCFLFDSVQTL